METQSKKQIVEEIKIGRLFGYDVELRDVPKERAEHVKKLAIAHMEDMNKVYMANKFGAVNLEIEVAKSLKKP